LLCDSLNYMETYRGRMKSLPAYTVGHKSNRNWQVQGSHGLS
jgi:hypothetical protein